MNKKYKIALILYKFSGGGLERVVSNSSFIFSKMGYDVHLYILNSEVGYDSNATVHQYPLDQLKGYEKIKNYFDLASSIQREKFDFIIDHRCRLNLKMEFLWAKFIYRNQKVFHYIHSSFIYHFLFKNSILNRFLYGKNFICVAKNLEKILSQEFPKLHFTTIYNPIYIHQEQRKIIEAKPYIICVARISQDNVKQIDVLLECYSKSLLPTKGIKLKILGDGERKKEMKALAQHLGIEHSVEFLGFIPDPYPYLQNAIFSVLTSKYEGLGMTLIESLAMGTPAISFDCPTGPSEIIQHRVNGLLVENQNKEEMIKAMNLLIENVELYSFLKSNTQKSLQKFSPEYFSQQWEKLFNENQSTK